MIVFLSATDLIEMLEMLEILGMREMREKREEPFEVIDTQLEELFRTLSP